MLRQSILSLVVMSACSLANHTACTTPTSGTKPVAGERVMNQRPEYPASCLLAAMNACGAEADIGW
jgi:hypothetical protein